MDSNTADHGVKEAPNEAQSYSQGIYSTISMNSRESVALDADSGAVDSSITCTPSQSPPHGPKTPMKGIFEDTAVQKDTDFRHLIQNGKPQQPVESAVEARNANSARNNDQDAVIFIKEYDLAKNSNIHTEKMNSPTFSADTILLETTSESGISSMAELPHNGYLTANSKIISAGENKTSGLLNEVKPDQVTDAKLSDTVAPTNNEIDTLMTAKEDEHDNDTKSEESSNRRASKRMRHAPDYFEYVLLLLFDNY